MDHPLAQDAALYTDLYQLTMAQGHVLQGRADQRASFDYFFRSNPFGGGYAIFSGIDELLHLLENLNFDDRALAYLDAQGFDPTFLDWLRAFEFQGDIQAMRHGEVVFPHEPIVRVDGPIAQVQIVETLLLNILNFSTLVATKASRIRRAAGPDRKLIDFGLRRAQGFGGLQASRAAYVGGFDATSQVLAGLRDDLPIAGTQAHAWIQSFDDELSAFRAYAQHFPDQCILLVDTYDTLKSGVPNAITVARELRKQGHELIGIRLDSGDLAYLAKQARVMLDDAGFDDVKIAASNQLDESVIHSLLQEQQAPIDVFGVGTQLITAYDDPALDGVYKLCAFDGQPRIKLSENIEKVNFPGPKTVFRLFDDHHRFYGDAIATEGQTSVAHMHHPYDPYKEVDVDHFHQEPLLTTVMKDGRLQGPLSTLDEARTYAKQRLAQLPEEHRRFHNPHIYKVGLSTALHTRRQQLLQELRG